MGNIKVVLNYGYADSFLYPLIGKQYFFRNSFPITLETRLRNTCLCY